MDRNPYNFDIGTIFSFKSKSRISIELRYNPNHAKLVP